MWSKEYETIGAYIGDGYAICLACFPKRSANDGPWESVSIAGLREDFGDYGLWCDGCMAEIVAPPDDDADMLDESAE